MKKNNNKRKNISKMRMRRNGSAMIRIMKGTKLRTKTKKWKKIKEKKGRAGGRIGR